MRAKCQRRWGRANSQEVGLEAAILERVRNSSLVECPCADNGSGLKPAAEAADWISGPLVGERSEAVKPDPGGPRGETEVRMPA